MKNDRDPLANILYVSIPDSIETHLEDFALDPAIPLPVETEGDPQQYNPAELSWELIIAGMLKVLAYDPDHEDADYYRAFVLATRPNVVAELMETGIINAHNGEFAVAEEVFRAVNGLDPHDPNALVNLAIVFEQQGATHEKRQDPEEAERFYEQAFDTYRMVLDFDDIPADAHLNAGLFFLKRRSFARARAELDLFRNLSDDEDKVRRAAALVAEIDTQNLLDTLFQEAYELIQRGREEEGVARARQFLAEYGDTWNAWFLVGWGERRLKRWDGARDAFERAVKLGGDNADTRNELAICSMELEDFVAAREHLVRALHLEPENAKIMSNFGVLELKLGNRTEARRFFQTVREIDPDDPVASEYLQQLADD